MFKNDKMIFDGSRGLKEFKKVVVNKFKVDFDKIFNVFYLRDEKDAINTGKGYDSEIVRVKHCITGVKNNLHKRHFENANTRGKSEFRSTKSRV